MKNVYQGYSEPGHSMKLREQALSPLLDLGDRLRARSCDLGNRDAVEPPLRLPAEGTAALLGAIETEIIPRLLIAHDRSEARGEANAPEMAIAPEDRERFVQSVMADSAAATLALVEALLERGVAEEAIFLDLLTHAARHLGELWEQDLCDFTEVTIGLCRLHQVLRELSLGRDPNAYPASDAPRVLLATACGDQHVFGVVMVAEFFRRAGWRVWSEPGAPRAQLCGLLGNEHFDVLGISVACSTFARDVAQEIGAFRKASCNTDLKILVGGRLFQEAPDLIDAIGADGMASDARTAPSVGGQLLSPR